MADSLARSSVPPIHIVLYEPEIPPNTGNIARTCTATGAHLHLIEPLGFSIGDRNLKRAGLDYRKYLDLSVHGNFDDFLSVESPKGLCAFSTKGNNDYSELSPVHPLNLSNAVAIVLYDVLKRLDFPGLT